MIQFLSTCICLSMIYSISLENHFILYYFPVKLFSELLSYELIFARCRVLKCFSWSGGISRHRQEKYLDLKSSNKIDTLRGSVMDHWEVESQLPVLFVAWLRSLKMALPAFRLNLFFGRWYRSEPSQEEKSWVSNHTVLSVSWLLHLI